MPLPVPTRVRGNAVSLSTTCLPEATDLIAATHIASHSYVQQAYSLIRPVHECCDLVELFAREPGEAVKWVNSPRPGVEYRPASVRRRIDAPPVSTDTYGHLSEMGSHPRFLGARASAVMWINREDPTERRVVVRMGSFYEDHPASVGVYVFILEALIRVGFNVRHLQVVASQVTRRLWLDSFLASMVAVGEAFKLVRQEFIAIGAGEGTEFMETVYDELIDVVRTGGPVEDMEPKPPACRPRSKR